MTVCEISPDVDKSALLAGAQFIDAFSIMVDGGTLDARHAAERMVTRQPRWAAALLVLRNMLVAPFGLKTSGAGNATPEKMVGIFPVVTETPDRLVAGFNDTHLDFRLVVDVAASGRGQRVTATTLVLTHNRFGRAYLAVILPFHRLIVPAMLRRVAV
jgi:Protein of unknown function (DUF2867)